MVRLTLDGTMDGAGTAQGTAAGVELLARFRAQMQSTARRYSANSFDAEDACQRAAEIYLTRAPEGSPEDICRWLRTTVKHEALAIRRRQARAVPAGEPSRVPEPAVGQPDTHERTERLHQIRLGAQALDRLKPQEVRCLLLRAEGYSYREICEETGWTYTKVNRCLTEGRRSFSERVADIEAGHECERAAPLLSSLADGEASPEELDRLRPHLEDCLACRARLREYRTVPARVAALAPIGIAAGTGGGGLRSGLESLLGATQERVAALGERAHGALEVAGGQKAVAVAASAAAIAGGGAAGVEHLSERSADATGATEVRPVSREEAPEAVSVAPPPPSRSPTAAPTPAPPPVVAQPRPQASPPPPAEREFAPEAAAQEPARPAPPAGGEFTPGGGGGGGATAEFAP